MVIESDDFDPFEEWVGMPEFKQPKQEAFAKIIVRVESQEDLDELSKRLEQKLTHKTKSVRFPFRSHWGNNEGHYICE